MKTAHSILPPSGVVRWKPCAGSARPEYEAPDRSPGPAALEGTRLHDAAADALNAVAPLPEDCRKVQGYIDTVLKYAKPLRMERFLEVEHPLVIDRIHSEMFGTPDCWFFDAIGDTVYLFDLKTGNQPVYSAGNDALVCYASGIVRKILMRHNIGIERLTFHLQICQGHIHESKPWVISGEEFLKREQVLFEAAHNAMSEDPKRTSGDHCRWCSLRLGCTVLAEGVTQAVELSRKEEIETSSDDDKVTELLMIERAFGLLKARESALKTELFEKLKAGAQIRSCGFKTRLGNRTWKDPQGAAGMSVLYPAIQTLKLLSPAQAEKAGVPKEVTEVFTYRPEKIELDLKPTELSKQIFGGTENE